MSEQSNEWVPLKEGDWDLQEHYSRSRLLRRVVPLPRELRKEPSEYLLEVRGQINTNKDGHSDWHVDVVLLTSVGNRIDTLASAHSHQGHGIPEAEAVEQANAAAQTLIGLARFIMAKAPA